MAHPDPTNSTSFFTVTSRQEALHVKDWTEAGCLPHPEEQTAYSRQRLTSPHTVALVDFDGDCLSDLFMTVQDINTGKIFYEIYVRREVENSAVT